ncbi:MAG: tetraacyldisaccharide 4'-kinase [Gammaproteobacteria bacterium]
MKTLDHYWYSQNFIAWLLLPLSWLFRALSIARRWGYTSGLLTVVKLPVPVIVVGNIAVGGTGKTPLLIALCDLLKAWGYTPGVISRGYASQLSGEALVNEDSTAAEVGDEPVLISRRTFCPVAVGKDRVAAAQLLLSHADCDIILSDDGLQHYRLDRDIEIAVIDAQRKHGNGFYLPAGPLREPVKRLESVDFVVTHGDDKARYHFNLEFSAAMNLATRQRVDLETLANERIHAVAGIGNPQRFFDQLEALGIKIIAHGFDDHHDFTQADLQFDESLPVLMTEKDAVKCHHMALPDLWYVPVRAKLSPHLIADFQNCVQRVFHQQAKPAP